MCHTLSAPFRPTAPYLPGGVRYAHTHTPDPHAGLAALAESAVTVRDLFVVDHPLIVQTGTCEVPARSASIQWMEGWNMSRTL